MSKLNDLRIMLSKLISGLNEIEATNPAGDVIRIAYETLEIGSEVYLINENGEYIDIPDGEYLIDAKPVLIKDGKVAEPEVVPVVEMETTPEDIENIRKEINELYARLDAFEKAITERIEKIEDKPAADPAVDVIENEPANLQGFNPKRIVAASKRNFK